MLEREKRLIDEINEAVQSLRLNNLNVEMRRLCDRAMRLIKVYNGEISQLERCHQRLKVVSGEIK